MSLSHLTENTSNLNPTNPEYTAYCILKLNIADYTLRPDGLYYMLSASPASFNESDQACRDDGGHVAMAKSEAQFNQVKYYFGN